MESVLQNIVISIGGFDYSGESPVYVPGDDSLACLKDLKRWLKLRDDEQNSWDVKSFLATTNIVQVDLSEIFRLYASYNYDENCYYILAIAAVEVLVPLTWPLELENHTTTAEQFQQFSQLKEAQKLYKKILIRKENVICLLQMASSLLAKEKPSERDYGMLRLILFLFRNICLIDNIDLKQDMIKSFSDAGAFEFFVVMASNTTKSFSNTTKSFKNLALVVLETIEALLRGIRIDSLFGSESADASFSQLKNQLQTENLRAKSYHSPVSSRHNRFGTMLTLKSDVSNHTLKSNN